MLEFESSSTRIAFEIGSYTNKKLVEYEGEPMFGELAILRWAEALGWEGAWLDTYHGDKRWSGMPHEEGPTALPPALENLLGRIRDRHGRRGGAWDVIVWNGREVAFLESKGPGDQLRESQIGWYAAAIAEGVEAENLVVVEWTVRGSPDGSSRTTISSDNAAKRSRGVQREGAAGASSLPVAQDFDRHLPAPYREKLRKMDFPPAMDNTLRRVIAGRPLYPSRLAPAHKRGLVDAAGTDLTQAGNDLLSYLDRFLTGSPYPPELLE